MAAVDIQVPVVIRLESIAAATVFLADPVLGLTTVQFNQVLAYFLRETADFLDSLKPKEGEHIMLRHDKGQEY